MVELFTSVFPRQVIVLEFKAKGKTTQYCAIDQAILTAQFVRNKCIRYWMDNRGVGQKELYRYNTALRAEFPFVNALNSHACQVAVERAYSAIARFYSNCKKSVQGKKGYPKFKKNSRSVEYKTSGWVRFVSSKNGETSSKCTRSKSSTPRKGGEAIFHSTPPSFLLTENRLTSSTRKELASSNLRGRGT